MSTIKASLLIVDDEAPLCSLLSLVFLSRGHPVRSAQDGFAALKLIREEVPEVFAADGFHEKARGLKSLFELINEGGRRDPGWQPTRRRDTPLWVDLEPCAAPEPAHVLINCPQCLRPFRQRIEEVHARIRETCCVYCGGHVAYAVALAINPAPRLDLPMTHAAPSPQRNQTYTL